MELERYMNNIYIYIYLYIYTHTKYIDPYQLDYKLSVNIIINNCFYLYRIFKTSVYSVTIV